MDYFGVHCKSCGEVFAVIPIHEGPRQVTWPSPAFPQTCTLHAFYIHGGPSQARFPPRNSPQRIVSSAGSGFSSSRGAIACRFYT